MSRVSGRDLAVPAFLVLVAAGLAHACGPFLPNRVTLEGDEAVLCSPVADFALEIARIKPPVPEPFKALVPETKRMCDTYPAPEEFLAQTADADLADLKHALPALPMNENERTALIAQYQKSRRALLDHPLVSAKWNGSGIGSRDSQLPRFVPPEIPRGLPPEFALYFRGAIHLHEGHPDKAREAWMNLLKLPEKDRPYRSTWAAFMIGKSLLDDKPADAIPWFQQVRTLARAGFGDSLGLASSSLGWEAQAQLKLKDCNRAIELYVVQLATGDPSAMASLQFSAHELMKCDSPVLRKAAASETVRKVATAYLLSGIWKHSWNWDDRNREFARKWVEAVEASKVRELEDADRLAWCAYQAGELDLARRWVAVAPRDSDMTQWINAKLLLHDGKVREATALLAALESRLPIARPEADGETRGYIPWNLNSDPLPDCIRGELGLLYLSQTDYPKALDKLLRGNHWEDAAYVAERVLTVDELKSVVDASWPERQLKPGDGTDEFSQTERTAAVGASLRYLLARRLTRLGRWKDARPYYPPQAREHLDAYVQAIRNGHDPHLPQADRAKAFWKVACLARYRGMELLGTELEGDMFVYGGSFPYDSIEQRLQLKDVKIVPVSADERRRTGKSNTPTERFHYRYIAADHAWQAALLMPDQSDDTARLLCIAGSWIKNQDPKAADRFYKAMVRRCGKTALGRQADELRWFPRIDVNSEELLK